MVTKITDYDYKLPEESIAQFPSKERSRSRLLALNRASGAIEHRLFADVVDYLNEGDVLVLNDTRVILARLFAKKDTGGKVEILLLREIKDGLWESLVYPSARVREGTQLSFSEELEGVIVNPADRMNGGTRQIKFEHKTSFWDCLERAGHVPLPPYIRRDDNDGDRDRYQTVFAKEKGAVAAPTAGLHFDKELLSKIESKGIRIAYITLHVGYGTFKPVKCEEVSEHKIHSEYYKVSGDTAKIVNEAKSRLGRVVACGTTVARSLESAADKNGRISPTEGETDIFIYPPYRFKAVDAMITNFHLPRTTLLMLVSAFAGRDRIMSAYAEAIKEGYRFYSYGDAMLIL
ncbi:MAG: tRNA preQ1(34) S-adenosylmethionine ribosyltransferase-isomerase QueA [Candidatus Omnitrophica bacterium]|nr:tRNA preQ1(34) S-adenosylmethionine ribosyltransferase-isomerase QueA [Candidatus Omnitrophota bacterium]